MQIFLALLQKKHHCNDYCTVFGERTQENRIWVNGKAISFFLIHAN